MIFLPSLPLPVSAKPQSILQTALRIILLRTEQPAVSVRHPPEPAQCQLRRPGQRIQRQRESAAAVPGEVQPQVKREESQQQQVLLIEAGVHV